MASTLKKAALIGTIIAIISGIVYAIFRIRKNKQQQ